MASFCCYGNSDPGEMVPHLKLSSFSGTPVMFHLQSDRLRWCTSRSKLNGVVTQISDQATLRLLGCFCLLLHVSLVAKLRKPTVFKILSKLFGRLFSHRLSIYARERKSERSERRDGGWGGVWFASEANKKSSLPFCAGVQFSRVITILTISEKQHLFKNYSSSYHYFFTVY